MTPERWVKIQEIFGEALLREPAERARYLTSACTDPSLLNEVELMIAAHEEGGSGYLEFPAAGSNETLKCGSTIGQYEVLAAIGAGGMGEVYRARDLKLGRQVAFKILPTEFAGDPERLLRFQREAKFLASLNHPNIASIYGLEDSGSIRALVMELVEGPTLSDRIKTGPIPIGEALPIARQIAEGLEYAHERGVVHRDLKPANIKITREDSVKILDFGLAKAVLGEAEATNAGDSPTLSEMGTQAGILLGTAAYMAPEQAKSKPVDRRADIWAFGCVLYEMLTGERAFAGDGVTETLAAVLKNEPDWSLLPALTPIHVRVLLHRCLRKDPKHRLRDIGDARISLDEVLSGGVEPGIVVSRAAWHRVLPWAAAFVAGALLLGGVFLISLHRTPRDAAMHFRAVTNFSGVQSYPALSPDARSVAFVSDRDGHYNIYVGLINGVNPVKLTNDTNLKIRPCWSPDGTEIAYARLNDSGIWDIWTVPALGGVPRRLILNGADPTWSRDGRSIAYRDSGTGAIWISDSYGQNRRELGSTRKFTVGNSGPRFSPDGREVAYSGSVGGPHGELEVVSLDSGKVRQLTHDDALVLSPAWSADGGFIYFASSRGGTLNIWKIAKNGEGLEQITAGQGDDTQLDVSSDGKRIVFSTFRVHMNIAQLDLDAAGQQSPKLLIADPARNQYNPAYSPDGKHLAYFSNLKGVEKEGIWLADSDGSNPVPLVQDERINIDPVWAPEGDSLVYASSSSPVSIQWNSDLRRISISGGAPQTVLGNAINSGIDVGPGGQLLFVGPDGKVQTSAAGKIQTLFTLPRGQNAYLFFWSPDRRSISYMVFQTREDDPQAGLWLFDGQEPPRLVFTGWVAGYARGPGNQIYVVQGKADMQGVLWKLDWSGHGLTRVPVIVPLAFDYWFDTPWTAFDVSPDSRHLAFITQGVLQANIGMLDGIR
jgi:eukaryotic-like serine/threonine-protein kinase